MGRDIKDNKKVKKLKKGKLDRPAVEKLAVAAAVATVNELPFISNHTGIPLLIDPADSDEKRMEAYLDWLGQYKEKERGEELIKQIRYRKFRSKYPEVASCPKAPKAKLDLPPLPVCPLCPKRLHGSQMLLSVLNCGCILCYPCAAAWAGETAWRVPSQQKECPICSVEADSAFTIEKAERFSFVTV